MDDIAMCVAATIGSLNILGTAKYAALFLRMNGMPVGSSATPNCSSEIEARRSTPPENRSAQYPAGYRRWGSGDSAGTCAAAMALQMCRP